MAKKRKKHQPSAFLKNAGQSFAYYSYRGIEFLTSLLPIGLVFTIGRTAGALAYLTLPSYRRLAIRNLTIAFGDKKSPAEIQTLAREHFRTLGANLLCSMKMSTMPVDAITARVELTGLENTEAASTAGNGLIFAICHMGCWEALAQTPAISPSMAPATLYQRLSNARLDAHILKKRGRWDFKLFDRKSGFYEPLAHLRSNGSLGILADQHAGDSGVWCPFFGRLASTSNLAALMSLRTGAPICAIAITTTGKARWSIHVGEPFYPKDHPDEDASTLTARLNLFLEQVIRKSPRDWFWVHNRWKTPKPNFLVSRYKRGICLPPGMDETSLKPFRILVRSPNWLGDACMAVPAVRAIKHGRPDAIITVLTPDKIADVWKSVPEVDTIITKGGKDSIFKVARSLKQEPGVIFDVALLLPNSLRTALEVWLAGIDRIVGYAGHHRRWLLNQIIPERSNGPVEHHVRHYLRMAQRIGAAVQQKEFSSALGEPPPPAPDGVVRIGLCPGAEYGPAKRWPAERFIATANAVAEEIDCEWLVFGSPNEADLGRQVADGITNNATNLAGKTTIVELIDHLRDCDLLLTNDTGTMHLAALYGIPTVSVFGSTEPAWTGPLGKNHTVLRKHVECTPCFLRECPIDFRCMEAITVDAVTEAVLRRTRDLTLAPETA
ncbi:MAG: glycosyltransferase family 9 protein [Verrucomicrobiales bacterium]